MYFIILCLFMVCKYIFHYINLELHNKEFMIYTEYHIISCVDAFNCEIKVNELTENTKRLKVYSNMYYTYLLLLCKLAQSWILLISLQKIIKQEVVKLL